MVLTHVDLIEKLLHYNRTSCLFVSGVIWEPESFPQLWSEQKTRRTCECRARHRNYTVSPDVYTYTHVVKYSLKGRRLPGSSHRSRGVGGDI
jgi:hypothetical protein